MSKLILIAVIAVSVNAQFEGFNTELRVNQEEGVRVSPRHQHRSLQNTNAGGFQNGNFASHDGRLKTNLNSGRIVTENSGQNFQPRLDTVVIEGAAFRRPDNHQFDVHSNLGRGVSVSNLEAQVDKVFERTDGQIYEVQQNGEKLHNIQNANINHNPNRFNNRNSQENKFNKQNIQRRSDEEIENESNVNFDNNGYSSPNDYKDTNSFIINNRENIDREAIDREINNQISKMIFDQSTDTEVTTKKNNINRDNGLRTSKRPDKQDDKWIWSDGSEKKNETTTVIPSVDDRAAFAGDQCPTGKTKFNNVCVDVD